MANNRMWLVCPRDDSHFLLAKAVAAWSARVDNDKFDAWIREHDACGFDTNGPHPAGTTIHFKLEYELTS